MALHVVKLPDIGEGLAEAEITGWHVKVGDLVREDDPLVDVMTDKATVEIPSPVTGRVVDIRCAPGETRAVGTELIVLEVSGDGRPAKAPAKPSAAAQAAKAAASVPAPTPQPRTAAEAEAWAEIPIGASPTSAASAVRAPDPAMRPLASPAVRRRAWEAGIPLQFVPGTGPGGRITRDDLERYRPAPAAIRPREQAAPTDRIEEVKVIGLRRRIGERMSEAKRRIPHFSYIEEVDVTALEELRQQLNAERTGAQAKLTPLPFLVRALARVLPHFPQINALYDDENGTVARHSAIHVGIATQTRDGLLVPVLKHAEILDLWAAAAEIARLAERARTGGAAKEQLSGSTITISSLGALGGLATTPVINYPEVAIVGVNRIAERPVCRGGQVVVRKMMNLSSSFDHRIVDGWDAAAFVQALKGHLEQPAKLFME